MVQEFFGSSGTSKEERFQELASALGEAQPAIDGLRKALSEMREYQSSLVKKLEASKENVLVSQELENLGQLIANSEHQLAQLEEIIKPLKHELETLRKTIVN